ncbi:MAG TPA: tyrosine-protein phosphatase [Phototrophicaceae bacterium]|jgi:protein-tyrosine phosphatase|nr:tyrosine-protein phosphatase [Phototrophicaceae bacterium]
MKWLRIVAGLVVGGGLVGIWQYQRRRKISSLVPDSLILQPELELDHYEGWKRIIPLKGAVNFRDIGGYETKDGYCVKWGRIYRSATLGRLIPEDLETLHQLNIKIVCDLREAREQAVDPDKIPEGVMYLHTPILTSRSRRHLEMMILRPHMLGQLMRETYTDIILENNAPVYGDLLRRVADPDNLPLLLHCSAGKDRTGIGVMLLLHVLGVPEETILADYSLTNRYFATIEGYVKPMAKRLRWFGVRVEDLQPLLLADPEVMRYALNYLHTHYGSVEQYLKVKAGIDDVIIEQLKANLLE